MSGTVFPAMVLWPSECQINDDSSLIKSSGAQSLIEGAVADPLRSWIMDGRTPGFTFPERQMKGTLDERLAMC